MLALSSIFRSLMDCGTIYDVYNALTNFYKGFWLTQISQKDPAKVEYWTQWYSDKLIETLEMCDTCSEIDSATIIEIAVDPMLQYRRQQR
jgi:hypothetical protein